MKRTRWFRFADILPTLLDADAQGNVLARFSLGDGGIVERECMWDWIPPRTHRVSEVWAANGFIEWRGLTERTK